MVAEKVQLVTLQSDEKWFFCLVRRRFVKSVPHLGCSPVDHKVHHKKHIDKFMVFGMTAFVPIENNWMRGGEAFKVILQRIGRMVEAKANSYGRVYGEVCLFIFVFVSVFVFVFVFVTVIILFAIAHDSLYLSLFCCFYLEWKLYHATN